MVDGIPMSPTSSPTSPPPAPPPCQDYSKLLPMELIDVFEHSRNWRESRSCLVRGKESTGKRLYAKVHGDPLLYKNLYRYLYYRFATPAVLAGVTGQLLRWEEDFHGQDKVEALACWRLHLGSSEVCKAIVQSVREPGILGRFYDIWMPVKDSGRRTIRSFLKRNTSEGARGYWRAFYNLWNTATYLVKPFVGASFFYFDILKDIVLIRLIYVSVMDLTRRNFTPAEYPFEFTILVALMGVFLTNVIISSVISVYYSQVSS